MLQKVEELEIVGEAENAQSAIRFLAIQTPDILITDFNMSGIALFKHVKKEYPEIKMIV